MAPRRRENAAERGRTPDPFVGMGAPRAEEAERYVLGCLLQYDQNTLTQCLDQKLRPEDFFSERHRAIAEAIYALYKEGQPTDLIATSERLKSEERLSVAGGLEYLQELSDGVASTAAVRHHCEIVKEKSLLRMVIGTANSMIFNAQEPDAEARKVLAKAQQEVSDLALDQVRQGLRPIRDLVEAATRIVKEERFAEVRPKAMDEAVKRISKVLLPMRKQTLNSVRYAADRIDDKVKFTDDALEMIQNVPRVFLPTVLRGCVAWARENNCELITAAEMKIINDKRSKEKSK